MSVKTRHEKNRFADASRPTMNEVCKLGKSLADGAFEAHLLTWASAS